MTRQGTSAAVLPVTLAAFALAVAGTLAILALPDLRFAARMPRARLAVESVAAAVSLLVSSLSYLRYSFGGARSWLLISVAFLVLGCNQLVFGVALDPRDLGSEQASYFWTAGRLIVGGLLVGAALPPVRSTRDPSGHLRRFALLAGASLAILAAIESVLWMERARLPELTSVPEVVEAVRVNGTLPDLSPVVIVLGVTGTALYIAAAAGFLRSGADPAPPWLPAALVLAGASHIHHMFFPSVFTDWVSTGDLLRGGFGLVLLGGLLWEVRSMFVAEGDRSRELATAYARERVRVTELEQIDRAKADLFEVLTHELMRPVAGIRGSVVTLRRRWRQLDEETRERLMEALDGESDRLRHTAEAAATTMALEDPGFSLVLQASNVAELAREAALISGDLEGRLTVVIAPELRDVHIAADRHRILQVLGNLLSNAEKFADPGSPIELRVDTVADRVRFSVTDRGPGLDPSQVPRIFQRFSHVRPAGREHVPGSGLGLYNARRIVEAHGGTFDVVTAPGSGSEFRFILPRRGSP